MEEASDEVDSDRADDACPVIRMLELICTCALRAQYLLKSYNEPVAYTPHVKSLRCALTFHSLRNVAGTRRTMMSIAKLMVPLTSNGGMMIQRPGIFIFQLLGMG